MGFLLIYTSLRAKGLTVYPVCPHRTPNVNFFVSKREFDYKTWIFLLSSTGYFNPLNAELNPIRHLLTLIGARHIIHVSRIRVKSHPPFASIGRSSPYCPR